MHPQHLDWLWELLLSLWKEASSQEGWTTDKTPINTYSGKWEQIPAWRQGLEIGRVNASNAQDWLKATDQVSLQVRQTESPTLQMHIVPVHEIIGLGIILLSAVWGYISLYLADGGMRANTRSGGSEGPQKATRGTSWPGPTWQRGRSWSRMGKERRGECTSRLINPKDKNNPY